MFCKFNKKQNKKFIKKKVLDDKLLLLFLLYNKNTILTFFDIFQESQRKYRIDSHISIKQRRS